MGKSQTTFFSKRAEDPKGVPGFPAAGSHIANGLTKGGTKQQSKTQNEEGYGRNTRRSEHKALKRDRTSRKGADRGAEIEENRFLYTTVSFQTEKGRRVEDSSQVHAVYQ